MENKCQCRICNVKMIWKGDYCVHCDWHLDQGYSPEEIKEIIKRAKSDKISTSKQSR